MHTCVFVIAGGVELPHVELQADDGEHEDGYEEQQADLQQGDHGLHDGLEHHLQAWRTEDRSTGGISRCPTGWVTVQDITLCSNWS